MIWLTYETCVYENRSYNQVLLVSGNFLGLVCIYISYRFDFFWELNYHHLASLGLGFGPSSLHGGS